MSGLDLAVLLIWFASAWIGLVQILADRAMRKERESIEKQGRENAARYIESLRRPQ